MNRSTALLTIPLALALGACARPPSAPGPDPSAGTAASPATPAPTAAPPTAAPPGSAALDAAALAGHHWRLQQAVDAGGARIDALFARADRPLQLDFRDGRLAVSNTCNRMFGGFSVDGATLTVARLASTMMACADPALMALDRAVGERLQGPLAAALQPGATPTLALSTPGGDVLSFQGVPTPQTRYGGAGTRTFLEVAPQRAPCSHPLMPDHRCLRVREVVYADNGVKQRTGEWQLLYQEIEGYTHEPGVRNVLRLDKYDVKNPPADGSSIAYVLDMVVESEVVKGG